MDNDNGADDDRFVHFLLGAIQYSDLLEQKAAIAQQYAALETIVATTNMNPKVLMREANLSRRKILLRIDATVTGETFLQQVITENSGNASMFEERLALGKLLQLRRKEINTRLYLHQADVAVTAVSPIHYLFLCLKHLKAENKITHLAFQSFQPQNQKDYNEKLVLACLLDEFIETKSAITNEMKKISNS